MTPNRPKSGISMLAVLWLCLIGAWEVLAQGLYDDPAPREVNFRPSVLATLAEALLNADDEKRFAFAGIALREMLAVYAGELDRAGDATPKSNAAQRKLTRWRSATRRYLIELQEISRVLETNTALRIHVDKQQRVLMFIGEHPVIINGPRIGRKKALEQRIQEEFCLIYDCSTLLAADPWSAPKPTYPLKGTWALDRQHRPTYETVDGLLFEFRNMSDRGRKEQACLAVIPELRELAEALKMVRETGLAIDWPNLALEAVPAGEDHRIVLNQRGDFVRLSLPQLEKTQGFWREALPWLRARADGTDYRIRFPDSERLLRWESVLE